MQQTEKYNLNLIETSDLFSAAPLNENAQKLETALESGLAAVRAEATAGISAGITAEAQARANADTAEAQTRANADAAEAQTRASAVTAEANARANADNALSQRVTALEAKHAVGGTYVGNSEKETSVQFINLGFTPKVVYLSFSSSKHLMLHSRSTDNYNKIVSGGFQVGNPSNFQYNLTNVTYPYIAIG